MFVPSYAPQPAPPSGAGVPFAFNTLLQTAAQAASAGVAQPCESACGMLCAAADPAHAVQCVAMCTSQLAPACAARIAAAPPVVTAVATDPDTGFFYGGSNDYSINFADPVDAGMFYGGRGDNPQGGYGITGLWPTPSKKVHAPAAAPVGLWHPRGAASWV